MRRTAGYNPNQVAPVRTGSLAALLIMALVASAADAVRAPYSSVKPVLEAMRDQLPLELVNPDEAKWDAWSRKEDAAIRARLEQGDLDSLVNLLLFGTSFTKQPRIQIQEIVYASKSGVLRARLDDLMKGLRAPAGNERLVFLRGLVSLKGMDPDTAEGAQKIGVFILGNLERVLKELRTYAQRAEEARRPADATPEFIERSRLFRDRGVSLDTSILPNFGIEETLRDLKTRGVLREGGVERAAVIGPGLDFIDWDSGYDYYPQQTLQPFAVHDSLLRLGLAKKGMAGITVLDISPRVLDHLRRARQRAQSGQDYVVQLPRDPTRQWLAPVVQYWRSFGDQIGAPATSLQPPALLKGLDTRAVRVRPAIVLGSEPVDLNIIFGQYPETFDVVVGTNIFVYYDEFEQALALHNVAAMLKPGGILLTNSALPERPEVSMKVLGFTKVQYAAGAGMGDNFICYQKQLRAP